MMGYQCEGVWTRVQPAGERKEERVIWAWGSLVSVFAYQLHDATAVPEIECKRT